MRWRRMHSDAKSLFSYQKQQKKSRRMFKALWQGVGISTQQKGQTSLILKKFFIIFIWQGIWLLKHPFYEDGRIDLNYSCYLICYPIKVTTYQLSWKTSQPYWTFIMSLIYPMWIWKGDVMPCRKQLSIN